MDRTTPALRPRQRTIMRQRWAHLLLIHWEVDPDQLIRLLPPGLQLDTFNSRAYVGLVPFTMTGVRPWWAPPFKPLSDFHETNVRTYVHRDGENPGVWFFSLDAANSTAVRVARSVWKLPYHRSKMSLKADTKVSDGQQQINIEYSGERLWPAPLPANYAVGCSVTGEVQPAAVGTLEHFLAERYLLYAFNNGELYRGQVHHLPYPLQSAQISNLKENMLAAAGVKQIEMQPLVHYASELRVRIFPLLKI